MSKKTKKAMSMLLVVTLIAVIAVGGMLAYLQSSDSDVNVMSLGNVEIEQHELQRKDGVDYKNGGNIADGDELEAFEQGQMLFPSTYTDLSDYTSKYPNEEQFWWGSYVDADVSGNGSSNGLWDDKLTGAMDKFVFVENTGKSDAYYRTIIAFECPEGMEFSEGSDKEFMMNVNLNNRFQWDNIGYVTIDGTRYLIHVATYQKALEPGTTSRPSLLQVVMTHNATNEDMELLGDTYEILALSQAVQTNGFENADEALDTGFGVVNEANVVEWFSVMEKPELVADVKSLDAALASGGDVILTEDLSFSSSDTTANSGYGATGVSVKGGTLNGNGNSLGINNWGTWDAAVHTTGGTIKNLTINSGMRGIFMGSATADVYIDNVTIDGTIYTFNSDGGSKNYGVYISNSTLNGWTSHSDVHKEVVYTNCNFGEGQGYAFCRPYGPTVFENCVFEAGFEMDCVGAVTFKNCTIGGVALTDANLSTLVVSNLANATVK